MVRLQRISGLVVLLLSLGASTGMLNSAVGESPPDTVTSDTLSYCRSLAVQLDQLKNHSANPPEEVIDLSVAGKDMCERGSVRAGIMRLRSAIVLLLHQPAGDALPVGRTE
jgi:hypothetical protein